MDPQEHIERSDKIQAVMRPLVHALNNRALAAAAGSEPLKIEDMTLMDLVGAYCEMNANGVSPEIYSDSMLIDAVTAFAACIHRLFENTAAKLGDP